MPETRFSSRSFNQGTSAAKKAAEAGPVIITERGKPTHVLITFDNYKKLVGEDRTLDELLYMPGIADIELEVPSRADFGRAADFS